MLKPFLHIATQFSMTMLNGIVSFILSLFLARTIGPSEFGVYISSLAIGAMLGILYDAGAKNLLIRKYASAGVNAGNHIFSVALAHLLILLTISILFFVIFADTEALLLSAVSACFFSTTLCQFIVAKFRGLGHYFDDALFQISVRIFSALCIYIYLVISYDLSAAGIFVVWTLSNFCIIGLYFKQITKCEFKNLGTLYRTAHKLLLIDLFITAYIRSDILILKFFGVENSKIGEYGAAFKVCETIVMFAIPIGAMILSSFSKKNIPAHVLKRNTFLLLASGYIMGLLFMGLSFLYSDELVTFLYGVDYESAKIYLRKLSIFMVFIIPNMILSNILLAFSQELFLMSVMFVAMIFNLCFNVILVPYYGVDGSIYAKTATEAFVCLTLLISTYKIFNVQKKQIY